MGSAEETAIPPATSKSLKTSSSPVTPAGTGTTTTTRRSATTTPVQDSQPGHNEWVAAFQAYHQAGAQPAAGGFHLRQHTNSAAAAFPAKTLRRDNPNVGVEAVVEELLASNAKSASNIASAIESRLLDRPYLLDNPATHGGALERAKDRARRARSKRSVKHFSMRQHRQAGSFDLPALYLKYELFRPMHEMWEGYARSLVAESNDANLQPRLLAADLHGAILAVVESKSTSYVGTQGIMIRETDQTFGIITVQDKLRVVPKAGAVFMLQLDSLRITLFGNNLFSRQLHPRKQQQTKPTIEL